MSWNAHVAYINKFMSKVDPKNVQKLIDVIWETHERGNTIFVIGNGGSASTASHFAQDIVKGTHPGISKFDTKPIRAMSLCNDVSLMTAISNDDGYEHVFRAQLNAYSAPIGDLLVIISGSGNSKNLIEAIKWAYNFKIGVFALLGYDGGRVKQMVPPENTIHVGLSDMCSVESIHSIILHYVVDELREKMINRNIVE